MEDNRVNPMSKLEVLDEKGFVFLDAADRPYLCRMWDGEPWLFYWHMSQGCWVSFREVSQMEIHSFPKNMKQELQDEYHRLHDEWCEKYALRLEPKSDD